MVVLSCLCVPLMKWVEEMWNEMMDVYPSPRPTPKFFQEVQTFSTKKVRVHVDVSIFHNARWNRTPYMISTLSLDTRLNILLMGILTPSLPQAHEIQVPVLTPPSLLQATCTLRGSEYSPSGPFNISFVGFVPFCNCRENLVWLSWNCVQLAMFSPNQTSFMNLLYKKACSGTLFITGCD